jgi:4-carboxymuconolactone decarboxylase
MMPRLEPTTEDDWDDETRELIAQLGGLNIFLTLAHHPKLLKRWLVFGGHVLMKSSLPPRERELAILRTGWQCASPYEFGQHTVMGAQAGLTDDEIRRVTEGPDAPGWSAFDVDLLRGVDELVANQRLGDQTWAALTARFSTEQVIDFVFTVGQYVLTCMALNTFEVPLDDGVPGFPE